MSGTDRGSVRAGGGERWREAALRRGATSSKVGNTIISTGNKQSQTLESELAHFSVETLHVKLGILGRQGSVGHGMNKRRIRGGSQGLNPLQKDISVAGNAPVPSGGVLGNGENVLNIQRSFEAVVH